jgi:hypothetical protein
METAPNSKISDDVLIWIMEYAAAYGLDTLTDGTVHFKSVLIFGTESDCFILNSIAFQCAPRPSILGLKIILH